MERNYDLGDVVRLEAAFSDADGNPADPTEVVLRVKGSTVVTYTPTRVLIGLYRYDFQPDEPGMYRYRFEGTGAVRAAGEGSFFVREPKV